MWKVSREERRASREERKAIRRTEL
ncbi:hypothetical protein A2U01_0117159, partial [Trifolium medium]|nr:hypothetical protein [Trifolium medium]